MLRLQPDPQKRHETQKFVLVVEAARTKWCHLFLQSWFGSSSGQKHFLAGCLTNVLWLVRNVEWGWYVQVRSVSPTFYLPSFQILLYDFIFSKLAAYFTSCSGVTRVAPPPTSSGCSVSPAPGGQSASSLRWSSAPHCVQAEHEPSWLPVWSLNTYGSYVSSHLSKRKKKFKVLRRNN